MTENTQGKNVGVDVLGDLPSKRNKNVFKINCIFDEKGADLESVIERAFGTYYDRRA